MPVVPVSTLVVLFSAMPILLKQQHTLLLFFCYGSYIDTLALRIRARAAAAVGVLCGAVS